MIANKLELKQALSKAHVRIKADHESVEAFKANVLRLSDLIDDQKDEEFNKNLLIDFLKKTYYGDRYFINTREKSDLVIHNDKGADSPVGVIFETKKPTKTGGTEMPKLSNLNTKAVQQLVLYFLRERVTYNNFQVKHLVVTNIYEWFVFDADIFDRLFYQDQGLVKQFKNFEEKQFSSKKTDFFYKEIAKPAIAAVIDQLKFTHFDLRKLESLDLTDLYKLLSPEHLLKLPFANDSNRLNKPFYNELLYIIGLSETKEKGKKLIGRVKEGDRQAGSLLENAISRLDSLGKLARLTKPEEFGETDGEKLFNVALRLSINWVNRILFLKLLEAQLIKYHQGDRDFAFLNLAKVQNYSDLNSLFFDVLAREPDQRENDVKAVFANVPYLNSSLFEPTETEQETILISNLKDRSLPIFRDTVLKDSKGNRRSGELNALAYLFEFLDAYKFDKDELEDTQEDSEKLINAAVLGLIFEKINGYKDGSFYTPSFITMYMCRETIRRAIVQKFNETKGWNCENIEALYEKIEDKKEANDIINNLKICDPAVGSGHFLVSALNEMIAIKSELKVLLDRSGKSLKDYRVEVKNDKLLVYDDEGKLFAYNPHNAEKQRVQEALFHEKQTLIESCLFGVDINPNSVTICRLRLWIELLKNAYYRADGNLETLPNIDINIKCGNSLISRFSLDLKMLSGKSKTMIEDYRQAVRDYQKAKDKGQKRAIEKLIKDIKASFLTTLTGQDPNKTKLRNLEGELYQLENQVLLFEESAKEKKAREKKVTKLSNEIDKLRAEIEEIESGRLYDQALEWRFEFPEVLNDDGNFVGFDAVIGNPPYIRQEEIKELEPFLKTNYVTYSGTADLYVFFVEKAFELLKSKGQFCYIMPNKWMQTGYGKSLRTYLLEKQLQSIIDFGDLQVFEEATTYPCIINALNYKDNARFISAAVKTLNYNDEFVTYLESISNEITTESLNDETWIISSGGDQDLLSRIKNKCVSLSEYVGGEAYYGIKTGLTEAFLISDNDKNKILRQFKSEVQQFPMMRRIPHEECDSQEIFSVDY